MPTITPGGLLSPVYILTPGDRALDPAGVLTLRIYRADGVTDPYAADGTVQIAEIDLPITPDGAAGIDPSLSVGAGTVTANCQYPYPVTSDVGAGALTTGGAAALPGGLSDQDLTLTVAGPFIQGDGTVVVRTWSLAFTLSGTGTLAPGYIAPLIAPPYTGAYADAGSGAIGNEAEDEGNEAGSLAAAGSGVVSPSGPNASGQAGVTYAQAGTGDLGNEPGDLGNEPGSLVNAAPPGPDLSHVSWSMLWGKPVLGAEDVYGLGEAVSVQDLLIPLLGTRDAAAASGSGVFSSDITTQLVGLIDDLMIALSPDGALFNWQEAVWIQNNAPNAVPPYWAALTLDGSLSAGVYLVYVRAAGQAQMLDIVTLT